MKKLKVIIAVLILILATTFTKPIKAEGEDTTQSDLATEFETNWLPIIQSISGAVIGFITSSGYLIFVVVKNVKKLKELQDTTNTTQETLNAKLEEQNTNVETLTTKLAYTSTKLESCELSNKAILQSLKIMICNDENMVASGKAELIAKVIDEALQEGETNGNEKV